MRAVGVRDVGGAGLDERMTTPAAPLRDDRRVVLVVAILASFVVGLDASVVNVALPAIRHELGGGLVVQQWVVDAYMVTLGSLILVAGSLSDLFGRVRIITLGLIVFGVASIVCAAAPTGEVLIVARALQGVGGALVTPSSLALIIGGVPRCGAGQGDRLVDGVVERCRDRRPGHRRGDRRRDRLAVDLRAHRGADRGDHPARGPDLR